MESVFADNRDLTAFELFLVEILKELFRQLKCESPRTLLQPNENPNPNYQTRLRKKNMFTPVYSRTVNNKKSLTNRLGKEYNWILNLDLVPFSLWEMSPRKIKQLITKITSLYIIDNFLNCSTTDRHKPSSIIFLI